MQKWRNATSTVRPQLQLVLHMISVLLSKTLVNLVCFPSWRPVDFMHEHNFTFSVTKWPIFLSTFWTKWWSVRTDFEAYYRDLQEDEDQCRLYQMAKYNYFSVSGKQILSIPTDSQSIQALNKLLKYW